MCAAGVDAVQSGTISHGAGDACFLARRCGVRFSSRATARLVQFAENREKPCFSIPAGTRRPILEDLREIGVNAVWPQLTAYDMEELAARLRRLGLACAIHVDRANVMTPRHARGCDARRACGGKGV